MQKVYTNKGKGASSSLSFWKRSIKIVSGKVHTEVGVLSSKVVTYTLVHLNINISSSVGTKLFSQMTLSFSPKAVAKSSKFRMSLPVRISVVKIRHPTSHRLFSTLMCWSTMCWSWYYFAISAEVIGLLCKLLHVQEVVGIYVCSPARGSVGCSLPSIRKNVFGCCTRTLENARRTRSSLLALWISPFDRMRCELSLTPMVSSACLYF